MQFDVTSRNARLAALRDAVGAGAYLEIRTGAKPASCAAATTGMLLASMSLPAPAFEDPAGGTMAKSGAWQDLTADAAGDAGHFRIFSSGGACRIQGTCVMPPLAPPPAVNDMVLDNTNIAVGQQVIVQSFSVTDGNA